MVRVIAAPQPVLVIQHVAEHGTRVRPDPRRLPPGQPACADRAEARPPEDRARPCAGRHAARHAPGGARDAAPSSPRRQPAVTARRANGTSRTARTTTAMTTATDTTLDHGHGDTSTTTTDAALLQLIWLASPALPVGGFSYSEGLEAAVEARLVHDEARARATGWCSNCMPAWRAPTWRWWRPRWQPRAPTTARARRARPVGAADARDQRAAPADRADGTLAGSEWREAVVG